jgi:hypothetical protein
VPSGVPAVWMRRAGTPPISVGVAVCPAACSVSYAEVSRVPVSQVPASNTPVANVLVANVSAVNVPVGVDTGHKIAKGSLT